MRDWPLSALPSALQYPAHVFARNRADAVSHKSADLFVFMPQNVGVMPLFTVNTERKNGREKERGRVVRWCRRWDFADSIFTHQTELFPVSTWPNSRSHHLTLLLLVFYPLPPLTRPFWQVPFQHFGLQRFCLSNLSCFTLLRVSSFKRTDSFSLSLVAGRPSFSSHRSHRLCALYGKGITHRVSSKQTSIYPPTYSFMQPGERFK